jgi:hypothetical protein
MPNNSQLWIWWVFSTILIAIFVNLVSAYTKPYADKILERYSDSRRIKNKKKREKIEKRVSLLLKDPSRYVALESDLTRLFIQISITIVLTAQAYSYFSISLHLPPIPENTEVYPWLRQLSFITISPNLLLISLNILGVLFLYYITLLLLNLVEDFQIRNEYLRKRREEIEKEEVDFQEHSLE